MSRERQTKRKCLSFRRKAARVWHSVTSRGKLFHSLDPAALDARLYCGEVALSAGQTWNPIEYKATVLSDNPHTKNQLDPLSTLATIHQRRAQTHSISQTIITVGYKRTACFNKLNVNIYCLNIANPWQLSNQNVPFNNTHHIFETNSISSYLTLPYLRGEQSVKQAAQRWGHFWCWPSAHPRFNQGYYNLNEALANRNRLDGDILHNSSSCSV